MDLKKTTAPVNTVTYNKDLIEGPTGNVYEAITIIAKRASQINAEIKKELIEKLEEFATYNDSLDEVFENKEQIEVSKYYEKLPKPHALAVEEWLAGEITYKENFKKTCIRRAAGKTQVARKSRIIYSEMKFRCRCWWMKTA